VKLDGFKKKAMKALVVWALYGLKSAGVSLKWHISDCMMQMGYQSCQIDTVLWTKAEVKPDDGTKYYAYLLLMLKTAYET